MNYKLLISCILLLLGCIVDKKSYALSIRDFNEVTHDVTIKHYRIRKMDRGGVFISPKRVFDDVLQLVEHYQGLYH